MKKLSLLLMFAAAISLATQARSDAPLVDFTASIELSIENLSNTVPKGAMPEKAIRFNTLSLSVSAEPNLVQPVIYGLSLSGKNSPMNPYFLQFCSEKKEFPKATVVVKEGTDKDRVISTYELSGITFTQWNTIAPGESSINISFKKLTLSVQSGNQKGTGHVSVFSTPRAGH